MKIVVCFAGQLVEDVTELDLPAGSTVDQAVLASGVVRRHPEIGTSRPAVGIWGRVVQPDTILTDGDRVELYRPLQADPREARRAVAERTRSAGRAGKPKQAPESVRGSPEAD